MSNLNTTALQVNLYWENPQKNLDYFTTKLAEIAPETHLVILPEMFTTGFSMNVAQAAEDEPGAAVNWMRTQARKYNFAITGSVMVRWKEKYYNRLYFVRPDGEVTHYDKRHLFTLAGENTVYQAGRDHILIEYMGWKIFPQICYDLRFPVFSRNTIDYDLLLYVANWPEIRIKAWDVLLQARAIENMSYCIGVNRVGKDGNDHPYCGHSAVYDSLGECLAFAENKEALIDISLDKAHLAETRNKFNFLRDRDQFLLKY